MAHHNPPNQEVAVVLERMAPATGRSGRVLEQSSNQSVVLERMAPVAGWNEHVLERSSNQPVVLERMAPTGTGTWTLEQSMEQQPPRTSYSEVDFLSHLSTLVQQISSIRIRN